MKPILRIARPVSLVLAVYAFFLYGPQPAALAALVETGDVLATGRVEEARGRIRTLLAQEEIRAAIERQGIDPAEAAARAEALSDAEAVRFAAAIDRLPAGGASALGIIIGALLIVFIVLLITDILGYTHVFPFTRRAR